ncbi:hypothetical protein EDB19DRAFT_1909241 [Suillus lakei]|nr:hypothetical protein EDB19DRAFT_1909241 [Suillus lakei]
MAHLTNVEIHLVDQDAFLRPPQLRLNLPSLTTGIASYRTEAMDPFTHTKLRSFTSTWPLQEFKAFLVRSKRPLESLILAPLLMNVTEEQRGECIPLIPFLRIVVDNGDVAQDSATLRVLVLHV